MCYHQKSEIGNDNKLQRRKLCDDDSELTHRHIASIYTVHFYDTSTLSFKLIFSTDPVSDRCTFIQINFSFLYSSIKNIFLIL